MMAETEVTKEVSKVVGIEEKCGLDMSSFQDLPKPDCNGTIHHNQANDLDNSYVFVTGTDGLPDDAVNNKDVVAEGFSVSPKSKAAAHEDQGAELDSQNEKLDAVGGQVSKSLNEGENENVKESTGDPPVVNDNTWKHDSYPEDGEQDQLSVADSLEKHTGKIGSSDEAEVKQDEDLDGNTEILAEAAAEKVEDQNVKIEGGVEGEQEKFDDLIKSESPLGPVENQESQVGAVGLVAESEEKGELDNISLHINGSGNVSDKCEDQISLNTIEALKAHQGSEDVVVDVVDCKSQDVSMDAEDEVKLAREVVETVEHEVPPSTSLDLDSKSYPIDREETPKEEKETTLSLDVLEDQQSDAAISNHVRGVLEQIYEAKTFVSNTDCHVETVCDLDLEEKGKDFSVSHVDNGAQYPEEPDKQPDGSGVSCGIMQSETDTEASVLTQSFASSNAHVHQTESEIFDAENIEAVCSSLVDGPKSQIIEKGLPAYDSSIGCATNEANSVSDSTLDTVVLTEKEPTVQCGEAYAETEVSSGEAEVANSSPATFDVKLEPEANLHNFSAISGEEKTSDVTVACRTEVSEGINIRGGAANIVEIENVEDMGVQLDGAAGSSNENLFLLEKEDNGNSVSNNISVASPEDCSANMINGEEASIKIKTKPFNLLIRVPRFDDENLREQIRLAKQHVDEKTKHRDAIQVQIQEIRANSQIHGIDYEYAKTEGRSARKLVRLKRTEIDSLQVVINKAKNALSIEDIDSQMCNLEHMIQHETLPLKEEKQLIREIKQLKQLREQLSSNMGSQDEIKQALEQKDDFEGRLKILRKELDILKNKVLKAETVAMEAEKKYDHENKKVKELQAQFRAADDVRQAAYAQWQSLRKELWKKSEYFFKYKDDAALASNFAFSRDTEALYRLCTNHVKIFMELWNSNDEFRREYVRFNARSTVRRFGTLDGRSLGPDEVPPVLPSYVDDGGNRMVSTQVKVDLASQIPTQELKQETTVENVTLDGKSSKKVTEHKDQGATSKRASIAVPANGLDTVSDRDVTDEVHEEPKKSREEIESIRIAEELRRQEAEAKLKEQRRLEELAKANEARERKKRKAEKLQMRAELKTQREAEQREKEREKRLRKKERKKAAATDANDTNNNCGTAPPSSESSVEIRKNTEVKDMPAATPKKPKKPWFTKQSKAKSVPPPLRNRNKKKLQQWMWVGITSLIIFVLFWLGNIGVFSNVNFKRRSPVI